MSDKICVLIPSYNEARTIGGIVGKVRAQGLVVYVVDDGSSDNSAILASAAGAIVIKNEKNMGKGAALREGFEGVLKDRFDAVIVMDGDGQHEAVSIPDFVRNMREEKADMVIGNRMLDAGQMPFLRRKTNRLMSYIISKVSGCYVPDTQCGYRLITRKVLENITLDSSNYEIESELIIKAGRKGFKICSVPVKAIYQDEQSKINPVTDTLRFLAFIVRIALARKG